MGKYVGVAGSVASLLALWLVFVDIDNKPILKAIFAVIAAVLLIVIVVIEICVYKRNKPKSFNRQENIDYMERIISQEGRVVVFAGNLSWVDNEKIKKTMMDKKGDLHLCVKHTARYLNEFRKAGVNVYTYGDNDFSPTTHFTIIRQGTTNAKLAITSILDNDNKEERHVYEISKDSKEFKDKWIVYAAEDLFQLVKILNGVK